MPLYNNVITNMNREDTPDEDKLGYEFWNAVEELPIIKQIKDYNETTARQSEYLAERARSGQSGLLSQGLQAVSDTLGTVVGLPFQALETGIQATSDRTNIDPRTLGAVKDIIGYSRAVKVPKSGKFYKGVQTAKKNIPRADILNPGQITVKPQQVVDEVFSLKRTKPPTALIPKYAQNAKIYLGDQPPTSTFMTTTGGDSSVPDWRFKPFDLKGSQYEKYRSDRLGLDKPSGLIPQQERSWYAKVTRERVLDEVLAQGGTKFEADRIFREHRDNLKPYSEGGSGMVASISELNRMAEQYSPGIQLRTETYTKNGEEYYKWWFKDKDGKQTRWDLKRVDVDGIVKEYSKTQWAKDHIIPVKDRKRIGGGYIGADNEYNLEHLLQWLNIQKSNTTQLYPGILKEMGVPETFSEYINMKLYPQNYEGMFVPQRWKENFHKIVNAEFYEKTKGIKSANKRKTVMNKLVRTWSTFFKDPVIVKGLEMLEEALGQQVAKNMEEGVAAGNEVPSWIGLLRKPPGGWDSKDSWWNDLPKDAKIRYRQMYDYKQRTITPYERPPQGTKDYEI